MSGIVDTIPEIKYFMMSDGDGIDRFLADSVSEETYPGIFLIRPQYRKAGDGSNPYYVNFDAKFYIFCKTPVSEDGEDDSIAREDEDLNKAEALSDAVGKILTNYNGNDETYNLTYCPIDFNYSDWVAIPVRAEMSIDNCMGYEVSFRLGLPAHDVI